MPTRPDEAPLKPNRVAVARQSAQRMQAELARQIQQGVLKAGDPLPSEHALAQSYGVSRSTAHNVLVRLQEEHLVYAITGVGAFVGSPGIRHDSAGMYLVLNNDTLGDFAARMQRGFEAEASRDGLATLGIACDRAQALADTHDMNDLRGLLLNAEHGLPAGSALPLPDSFRGVPIVQYGEEAGIELPDADRVTFDQVDGGRQAAQHLLEAGHTRIAFLALHRVAEGYEWSRQRAHGWRDALRRAGAVCDNDAILMPSSFQSGFWDRQVEQGYDAGSVFAHPCPFTAVVAADDAAAMGLVRRLQESGRSPDQWPAIVSFDDTEAAARYGFTSLRHPWEDLGKAAAELLCERRARRLTDPPMMRTIRLQLIKRGTSRSSHYAMVDELVRATTS
jgi:GntR family transcriptional regulator, arabinose operon transcriptional repressor